MTQADADGWNGPKRTDGTYIRFAQRSRTNTYAFEIVPNDARPPLNTCPCCAKSFATLRAAQLVANIVYPPKDQTP